MCCPEQHFSNSTGDDLSSVFTNEKSCTVALPAPPPPPDCDVVLLTPQEKLKMSISPLCLWSLDSPSTPSIFKNMSTAMRPPQAANVTTNSTSSWVVACDA